MDRKLRSPRVPSQPAHVRFLNLAQRTVNLTWIDFEGHYRSYGTLNFREYFDVATYVGHVWIFLDRDTLERMQAFSDKTRSPSLEYTAQPNDGTSEQYRKWVFITLPVYSLKELCFQTFRRLRMGANSIKECQLPRSLTEDYHMYMVHLFKNQLKP